MQIILAIILGFAFGFALDRAKASNPDKIINMLRLKDFHLMKVILFAIGFSSLFLFILLSLNIIDPSHLSVKSSYWGVILGGGILGLGFAIGGYCPGTSIVAAARGRTDAVVFILGGFLGALVYLLVFGVIKDTALFTKIAGGAVSIADLQHTKYASLITKVPAIVIGAPLAILFMVIAFVLPSSTTKE